MSHSALWRDEVMCYPVTALAAALPGNAGLPTHIPDCSDVPSSHPEQPVPGTNASSLAVAGN